MAKSIFKNLGKAPSGLPPSQIRTPNIYAQSLAETKAKGDYEQSIKALSPITYQQANKLNFQLSKLFANVYHGVSFGPGLATVSMLAYLFSGAGAVGNFPQWLFYLMFGLTFIILSALLIGIEVFKERVEQLSDTTIDIMFKISFANFNREGYPKDEIPIKLC